MPKPEFEFFDVGTVDWTPVDERVPGLWERILARDDEGKVATRMLRFEPGTNTTAAGAQIHSFWEEVYILEGALHDLSLDQTFQQGSYACRPPGMRHGPWVAPGGCVTFEVRYGSAGPPFGPRGAEGAGSSDANEDGNHGARGSSSPLAFGATAFRHACGQFPTGVTIVTARAADGSPVGVTVNSFTSVSLEPPLVLICLAKRLGSYAAFWDSRHYAVHILAAHQAALSTRFASRGVDKFAGLGLRTGLGGVPILPGYLALFECEVVRAYDAGDHTIFAGRVERLEVGGTARSPLAFFRGKYASIQEEAAVRVPPEAVELWSLGWA